MRPFQDRKVWQLAHRLTMDVWHLTHGFPARSSGCCERLGEVRRLLAGFAHWSRR